MSDDQQVSQHKFKLGRIIASPDKETRQKGIATLKSWLKKYTKPTELDYLKVWKALFYCVWVTDNSIVHYELVQKLAKLVHDLPDNSCFFLFVISFYKTINREWQGIDKYRIEKYLWLMRFFFYECLCFLQKQDWNEELIDTYNVILLENVFITKEHDVYLGIKMHLVDVFFEEIKKIFGDEFWTASTSILLTIFYPFFCILSSSNDTALKDHVEQNIFDELLIFFFNLKIKLASAEDKTPDLESIRKSMSDLAKLIYVFNNFLFSLASSKKTSNVCRKQLYQIHQNIKSNMENLNENEEEVDGDGHGPQSTNNDTDENNEISVDSIDTENDRPCKKGTYVSDNIQEQTFASVFLRSKKAPDTVRQSIKSNNFKRRKLIRARCNSLCTKLVSTNIPPPSVCCNQQINQLTSTMVNCGFSDDKTQLEPLTASNTLSYVDMSTKNEQSTGDSLTDLPSSIYSNSILDRPPAKRVKIKKVCFNSIAMVKRYSTKERIQPILPISLTSQPIRSILKKKIKCRTKHHALLHINSPSKNEII
ncbi:ribosomal RNA processing protein 1 homolog [Schistocerca gregaria]|uniref:ribosomal RNA processing protein 1 homolog n=1 Tax=Schistocerca gregaria TaxID=7010 RepID=UPI00211EAFE7|nr:ribosomal RNA processing protein 1 homolog [Schistocerca gregaria]